MLSPHDGTLSSAEGQGQLLLPGQWLFCGLLAQGAQRDQGAAAALCPGGHAVPLGARVSGPTELEVTGWEAQLASRAMASKATTNPLPALPTDVSCLSAKQSRVPITDLRCLPLPRGLHPILPRSHHSAWPLSCTCKVFALLFRWEASVGLHGASTVGPAAWYPWRPCCGEGPLVQGNIRCILHWQVKNLDGGAAKARWQGRQTSAGLCPF